MHYEKSAKSSPPPRVSSYATVCVCLCADERMSATFDAESQSPRDAHTSPPPAPSPHSPPRHLDPTSSADAPSHASSPRAAAAAPGAQSADTAALVYEDVSSLRPHAAAAAAAAKSCSSEAKGVSDGASSGSPPVHPSNSDPPSQQTGQRDDAEADAADDIYYATNCCYDVPATPVSVRDHRGPAAPAAAAAAAAAVGSDGDEEGYRVPPRPTPVVAKKQPAAGRDGAVAPRRGCGTPAATVPQAAAGGRGGGEAVGVGAPPPRPRSPRARVAARRSPLPESPRPRPAEHGDLAPPPPPSSPRPAQQPPTPAPRKRASQPSIKLVASSSSSSGALSSSGPRAAATSDAGRGPRESVYEALWACVAGADNELSFERGERLVVTGHEYEPLGWLVARLADSAPAGVAIIGLVPANYVAKLDSSTASSPGSS